jgi:hypothetical protein
MLTLAAGRISGMRELIDYLKNSGVCPSKSPSTQVSFDELDRR